MEKQLEKIENRLMSKKTKECFEYQNVSIDDFRNLVNYYNEIDADVIYLMEEIYLYNVKEKLRDKTNYLHYYFYGCLCDFSDSFHMEDRKEYFFERDKNKHELYVSFTLIK